jgi:hypothetical protein
LAASSAAKSGGQLAIAVAIDTVVVLLAAVMHLEVEGRAITGVHLAVEVIVVFAGEVFFVDADPTALGGIGVVIVAATEAAGEGLIVWARGDLPHGE